jgi:hypothetical protein
MKSYYVGLMRSCLQGAEAKVIQAQDYLVEARLETITEEVKAVQEKRLRDILKKIRELNDALYSVNYIYGNSNEAQ